MTVLTFGFKAKHFENLRLGIEQFWWEMHTCATFELCEANEIGIWPEFVFLVLTKRKARSEDEISGDPDEIFTLRGGGGGSGLLKVRLWMLNSARILDPFCYCLVFMQIAPSLVRMYKEQNSLFSNCP